MTRKTILSHVFGHARSQAVADSMPLLFANRRKKNSRIATKYYNSAKCEWLANQAMSFHRFNGVQCLSTFCILCAHWRMPMTRSHVRIPPNRLCWEKNNVFSYLTEKIYFLHKCTLNSPSRAFSWTSKENVYLVTDLTVLSRPVLCRRPKQYTVLLCLF